MPTIQTLLLNLWLFFCPQYVPMPFTKAGGSHGTFGDTTIEATTNNPDLGELVAAKFSSPATTGTVSSMSVYASSSSTCAVKTEIYADSSGTPGALLADSSAVTVTGATPAWYNTTISYAFSASTNYWLNVYVGCAATNLVIYTNHGGATNQLSFLTGQAYPTAPNPFGTPGGQVPWYFSIYATY